MIDPVQEFNEAITIEIDMRIAIRCWYLAHPVESPEYKLMKEYDEIHEKLDKMYHSVHVESWESVQNFNPQTQAQLRVLFDLEDQAGEIDRKYFGVFDAGSVQNYEKNNKYYVG